MKALLTLTVLALGLGVHAEEKAAEKATEKAATGGGTKQTCTHGKDIRVLELKEAAQGCELVYTKAGEAKTIATAKNEKAYCEGVSQKVSKKLQDSGFTCE